MAGHTQCAMKMRDCMQQLQISTDFSNGSAGRANADVDGYEMDFDEKSQQEVNHHNHTQIDAVRDVS